METTKSSDRDGVAVTQKSQDASFPPELWLEVFEKCDYETLKILLRVSRLFRDLISGTAETSEIRKLLFRDPIPGDGGNVRYLHPVLDTLFIRGPTTHGCYWIPYSESQETGSIEPTIRNLAVELLTNLCNGSKIWQENATSPAFGSVGLMLPWPNDSPDEEQFYAVQMSRVNSDGALRGVTVADVIVALVHGQNRAGPRNRNIEEESQADDFIWSSVISSVGYAGQEATDEHEKVFEELVKETNLRGGRVLLGGSEMIDVGGNDPEWAREHDPGHGTCTIQ